MKKLLNVSPVILGLLSLLFISLTPDNSADNKTMQYVDQNNNSYEITVKEVSYTPIKASESSSGMYSGGEAWKKEIDNEVYFVIETYFNKIINNKANTLDKRSMPSIILKERSGKKEKVYFSKPDKEFDEYMKSLKTSKTKMD